MPALPGSDCVVNGLLERPADSAWSYLLTQVPKKYNVVQSESIRPSRWSERSCVSAPAISRKAYSKGDACEQDRDFDGSLAMSGNGRVEASLFGGPI